MTSEPHCKLSAPLAMHLSVTSIAASSGDCVNMMVLMRGVKIESALMYIPGWELEPEPHLDSASLLEIALMNSLKSIEDDMHSAPRL